MSGGMNQDLPHPQQVLQTVEQLHGIKSVK